MVLEKPNRNKKFFLVSFISAIFLLSLALTGLLGITLIPNEDTDGGSTLATNALSWQQTMTFGGADYDDGFAIAKDTSDNLYLACITKETGDYDVLLIKCDSNGNQLWNSTWGGPSTETVSDIALDHLGNIYLTGITFSYGVGIYDMFIVKFNSVGVKAWNYTWGVTGKTASGNSLLVQFPGYIYVVGTTNVPGFTNMLVVKYDSSGIQLWNYTWGSSGKEYGYDIAIDQSGTLYAVGSTTSYGAGGKDLLIVKINAGSPSYVDHETWGGIDDDSGNSIFILSDQIYITGFTKSYGNGGSDVILLNYDTNLDLEWSKTYGGAGNSNESASDVAYFNNSLLIVGNKEFSDIILVQYLTNGDYVSNTIWDTGGDELAGGVIVNSTGTVFVVATTDGLSDPLSDIVLLKFAATYPALSSGGIPAFGVEYLLIALLISTSLVLILRKNQKYLQAN
ncbi:MAG: hypothetical protein ACTSQI_14455 [Candidatus Helarchaeota archaeon]